MLTKDCVLDMLSAIGGAMPSVVTAYDKTRYANHGAITTATWAQLPTGLWVSQYNGTDYIACPATTGRQTNFTYHSFTISVWIGSAVFGGSDYIVGQGATDVDGWGLYIAAGVNTIALRTNQAGSHTEISATGIFTLSTWQQIVVTRAGNTGQFYLNGVAFTTAGGGTLVNPVSVAGGNELIIGIANDKTNNGWEGKISIMKIYNYALSTAQIRARYHAQKYLFGVAS